MENILPLFGNAVRNARDHQKRRDGKRRQAESSRKALKNISNNAQGQQVANDRAMPSKKFRRIDSESKDTSLSVKRQRSIHGTATLPSRNTAALVAESSFKDRKDNVHRADDDDRLIQFYESDFALTLTKENPSETIFEVPQYVVDMYFFEQERELMHSNIIYDFFTSPLPIGVHGPELVHQTLISKEILSIVVDWMVEVQENMEMNHETIYLAVIMMYRYMSVVPNVSKKSIQLLACTCMWVASKYEERMSPAVRDYIYICDNAFAVRDFIAMEQRLFIALDECCHRPNSYVFLRRYSRVADGDNMKLQFLSRYFLELTLQKQSLMLNRESFKAAGALWLARVTLKFDGERRWPPALRFFTQYDEIDMVNFVTKLHSFVKDVPHSNLQTTFVKYSNRVFLAVATIPPLSDHDLQNIFESVRGS